MRFEQLGLYSVTKSAVIVSGRALNYPYIMEFKENPSYFVILEMQKWADSHMETEQWNSLVNADQVNLSKQLISM